VFSLNFKISILYFFLSFVLLNTSVLLSQEIEDEYDPQDFESIDISDDDFIDLITNNVKYFSQFRMSNKSSTKKWQYIDKIKTEKWNLALRSDVDSDNGIRLSKFYGSFYVLKSKIVLGNIGINFGQGLLFSNKYGRMRSVSNPGSVFRDMQKTKEDLSSAFTKDLMGVGIIKNIRKFTVKALLLQNNSHSNPVNIGICEISKISKQESVSFHVGYQKMQPNILDFISNVHFSKKLYKITFSGEVACSLNLLSYIINLKKETGPFSILLQKRYFPKNWQSIIGGPVSGFSSGENETGLFCGFRFKNKHILMSAWIDMYKENEIDEAPINIGSDKLIYLSTNLKQFGKSFVQIREKEKYSFSTSSEFGIESSMWILQTKQNFKFQHNFKRYLDLKISLYMCRIKSELLADEKGSLLSVKIKKQMDNNNYEAGLNIYKIDSWDARIYQFNPSLRGEFNLKAFYGKGCSFFAKTSYKFTPQTIVSFRGFLNFENMKNNIEQEFSIQMEFKL
jgi:hypothetical protein